MSGSHQFYTATGRALPLPPKRTPSRHSSVLRLPTRRAEQERSTTVRADSPGRIELPHGGEFHTIPESQRAISQLVVYEAKVAEEAKAAQARVVRRSAASSKASSVTQTSRRHGASLTSATATAAAAAAASAAPTSPHPSSVMSGLSPPPHMPAAVPSRSESYVSSRRGERAVNRTGVYPAGSKGVFAAGTAPSVRESETTESGRTTPRGKAARTLADSSSDSSSPCLNRMKSTDDDEEAAAQERKLQKGSKANRSADVHRWRREQQHQQQQHDTASEVQSIPMSSARQSRAPEEREKPQRHEAVASRPPPQTHHPQLRTSSSRSSSQDYIISSGNHMNKYTHNAYKSSHARSVASQSSVSQYSSRPREQNARRTPQHYDSVPSQQQQQEHPKYDRSAQSLTPPTLRQRDAVVSAGEAAAPVSAKASQQNEFSSYRQGPPSRPYAESESTSRPAAPVIHTTTNAVQPLSKNDLSKHSDGDSRAIVVPVFVSPIVPHTPNSVTQSYNNNTIHTNTTNENCLYHPSHMSSISNGNTNRPSVDRHDHLYSQHKMDQRRASRPAASAEEVAREASYRPPAASQALALVPAPAVVKYSTRSSRSEGDDPLEMNTPIANRVRQRSVVSSSRMVAPGNAGTSNSGMKDINTINSGSGNNNYYKSSSVAPATSPYLVGTLEGTELLPSLPKLQGRKTKTSEEDDRVYRTIVRFIEYQPEAERPELEAMLRDFRGREEELCDLLTETYGEDFEMLKSACHRGPSVPLLADRPVNATSPSASQRSATSREETSRVLLLGDAATTHVNRSGSHLSSPQAPPPQQQQQHEEDSYTESSQREDNTSSSSNSNKSSGVADEDGAHHDDAAGPPSEAVQHYEEYEEPSRPSSTPRVEEGDYDEEPMYDEDNYAREMLTPALPYERR